MRLRVWTIIKFIILLIGVGAVIFLAFKYVKKLDSLMDEDFLTGAEGSRRMPEVGSVPGRIVSLAPNITEILYELGAADRVVGVSTNCNWPEDAKAKQTVGSFWQPDREAILQCRPDMVFSLWFEQQKQVADSLERLGYRVVTLRLDTVQELYDAIGKIAEATGSENEGKDLTIKIKDDFRRVSEKVAGVETPRVLWVVQEEPLRVAGRDTFLNSLIEMAGGVNAVGETIQQYPALSKEELIRSGPQVIIESSMTDVNMDAQRKAAEKRWQEFGNFPAVRDGRIYVIGSDMVLRLGPRTGEGVEKLARLLHPEVFDEVEEETLISAEK